ncbi:MAG TPA: hypothetical protein VGK43_06335 [Solirubrobacterales bacterium]
MPRKYEVLTCPECGAGVRIEPTEGGTEGVCLTCDWAERGDFDDRRDIRKPLPVAAIDSRDVQPLTEALREAIDMVHDWASYASDYFQEKHDLEGDEAKLRAALKAFEDEEGSGG